MKIRYLLPLASLVLAASAQAAPAGAPVMPAEPCAGHHRHHAPPPGAFIERLDERADLDLSADQKQKLKAIGEEERARHEAIRKDYQERFAKVLTPAQRARLDAERENMRKEHADRLDKRAEQMKERAEQIREHREPAR